MLIAIGDRVLLGADVAIADTDFHPVDALPRRYAPSPEPEPGDRIISSDDVFVRTQSIILGGFILGEDCAIGAGSVVKGEIPPRVIAAGNPCRILRPVRD